MWKVEWPLLLNVMNERSGRSKLNRYSNTSPAKCAQHIKWIKMNEIFFSWNYILLCWNNDMKWISLLLIFLAEKQKIICTVIVYFSACLHLNPPPPNPWKKVHLLPDFCMHWILKLMPTEFSINIQIILFQNNIII